MKKRKTKNTDEVSGGEGILKAAADTFADIKRRFGDAGENAGIIGKVTGAVRGVMRHRVFVVRALLPMIYCFFFGGTEFEMGIYPFGIAAVCAAQSGLYAAVSAAAVFMASLFVRGGFYIVAACAACAAALAVMKRIRGDGADDVSLRAVLSMVVGGAQTLVFSVSGGVNFYEICAVLLSMALCPVLTVALRGLFISSGKMSIAAEAGIYALAYTALYALRWASPVGASLAIVISMAGSLFATYTFGMQRGIVTGVVFGLAASAEYSLIYATAAAGAGMLMSTSPMAAVFSGVFLALAIGIHGGGAAAFGDLFPELLLCTVILAPLLHYRVLPVLGRDRDGGDILGNDTVSEEKVRHTKRRLKALSENLGAVASVMRKLSAVLSRPSFVRVRQMCDESFDESCRNCDKGDVCWNKEYRCTASSLSKMASTLRCGSTVDAGYLTEGIRTRCPHTDEILARVNTGASLLRRNAEATDTTAVYADGYLSMSRLIGEISDDGEGDFEYDAEASATLSERFGSIGVHSAEVSVYGKRRRRVFVRGLEAGCSVGVEEIRNAASSVLGCPMNLPEYRIDGRRITMNLHTEAKYAVSVGRCSIAKKGERCGDSITSFPGDGGYFYTLISDGMGSGGEAAATSGISAMFLERLLGSGCSLSASLEMLNSFLARRNTECFTTVDLMEADLITGELRFIKSGAAPSFVLRDGRLFRLAAKTVPVGIVTPFDAEQLKFTAREGDFIIMISDGAVPDGEDPAWLYEMLCGKEQLLVPGCDLGDVADRLTAIAANRCGYSDDVTVGIAEIKRA